MTQSTPAALPRTLSVFSLVMINVIAVDSLRILPFSAVYGFSLVFYYLLAAITFLIPTALVSAELATAWPNKGGIYVWIREAFGERWGFVSIWLQWVYNIVWYPTILTFLGGAVAYLINPGLAHSKSYMLSVILTVFWGATLLNCFGMRLSGWVSTFCALIGTLIPMLLIIVLGIIWIGQGHTLQIAFTSAHFWPDLRDIHHLSFLLVVLFGLVGMEMSAVHADEVKNPERAYPRAAVWSVGIILITVIFSALAIAIVVPHPHLSIVNGVIQAFHLFLNTYHLNMLTPLIVCMIIIGGIGSIAAWIIGPTKGLLVAARDGNAPQLLGRVNKHGVPIIILGLQACLCSLLCVVFLWMPTVQSAYWVLTAITGQLAMLVYVLLFPAAIYLRYKKRHVLRAYTIPFGNVGMTCVGILGVSAALFAIAIGFVPPEGIKIGSLFRYESSLVGGMLLFCILPICLYRPSKVVRKNPI